MYLKKAYSKLNINKLLIDTIDLTFYLALLKVLFKKSSSASP